MASGSSSQSLVTSEQGSVQGLGERNVDSVICCQIVAQLPDPRKQEIMRIPRNRKIGHVPERFTATFRCQLTRECVPAKHLCHFDVYQVWGVKGLSGSKKPLLYGCRSGSAEEHLERRGSIDDDHRLSRSARTARAGDTLGLVAERRSSRARSSSTVGRSTTWRTSFNK